MSLPRQPRQSCQSLSVIDYGLVVMVPLLLVFESRLEGSVLEWLPKPKREIPTHCTYILQNCEESTTSGLV